MTLDERLAASHTDDIAATMTRIESLLADRLHLDVPSPDTDLFETGLVDSLAFVDLLLILQSEFGIGTDMDDFEMDELRTLGRMAAFVQARRTRLPGIRAVTGRGAG